MQRFSVSNYLLLTQNTN